VNRQWLRGTCGYATRRRLVRQTLIVEMVMGFHDGVTSARAPRPVRRCQIQLDIVR
jgi:hypothetical protein